MSTTTLTKEQKKEALKKKVKSLSNDWDLILRDITLLKPRVRQLLNKMEKIEEEIKQEND